MGTYARVPSLVEGLDRSADADLQKVMERVAAGVGDAGERGALQVSLGADEDGAERRGWTISLEGHEARAGRVERPDVEMLASVETFWRLVDGSYSPVEAWRDGRLRVRGDEQLGKRVLRHLAGPEGKVDC